MATSGKKSRDNAVTPPKRGRGRPSTGNAKSDAERARLYRMRKKQRDIEKPKTPVASAPPPAESELELLKQENDQLRRSLVEMMNAVDLFIDHRQSKKKMHRDMFRNICQSHLKVILVHKDLFKL